MAALKYMFKEGKGTPKLRAQLSKADKGKIEVLTSLKECFTFFNSEIPYQEPPSSARITLMLERNIDCIDPVTQNFIPHFKGTKGTPTEETLKGVLSIMLAIKATEEPAEQRLWTPYKYLYYRVESYKSLCIDTTMTIPAPSKDRTYNLACALAQTTKKGVYHPHILLIPLKDGKSFYAWKTIKKPNNVSTHTLLPSRRCYSYVHDSTDRSKSGYAATVTDEERYQPVALLWILQE